MRWREQCQGLLTLADSEPKDEYDHSLSWVMVGKAKLKGGVKWVSSPHVRRNDDICLPA